MRHSWKHSTSASILSMHCRSRGCRSCQRSITPRRLKVATLNVAVAPPCILLGVARRFARRLPNKRRSTDWAKGAAAKPRKAPREELKKAPVDWVTVAATAACTAPRLAAAAGDATAGGWRAWGHRAAPSGRGRLPLNVDGRLNMAAHCN